jgi:hypothetical protein
MPRLESLPAVRLTLLSRMWLIVLRVYLVVAVGLVVYRVAAIVLHRG